MAQTLEQCREDREGLETARLEALFGREKAP
jgi:hypothetical protein